MTNRRLVVATSFIAPVCFVAGFLLAEAPPPPPPPPEPAPQPAPTAPQRPARIGFPEVPPLEEADPRGPTAVAQAAAPAPAPDAAISVSHAAPAPTLTPFPAVADPIQGALATTGDAEKRVDLYASLAEECKQQEFDAEARRFALAGLALDPKHDDLLGILAELDPSAMQPFLEAGLADRPDDWDLLYRLDALQPGEASRILQAALGRSPGNSELLRALLGRDKVPGLRLTREALRLDPENYELIGLLASWSPNEALPHIFDGIAEDPTSAYWLDHLVEAMESLETPGRATPYLESVLASTTEVSDRLEVIHLLTRTNPHSALAHYAALDLPEDPETMEAIVRAHLKLGQVQEGLRVAHRLYDLQSVDDDYTIVGTLLEEEESQNAGVQLALEILRTTPDQSGLYDQVASALCHQERYAEVAAHARRWVEGTSSSSVAYSIAETLNEHEETREVAMKAYVRSFHLDASDTEPLDYLEEHPRLILEAIHPYLDRQPKRADLRTHLRRALRELADREPGMTVAYFDRFPRDPLHRDARFLDELARDAGGSGDHGGLTCARELLRRAERLDPHNEERAERRKELGLR